MLLGIVRSIKFLFFVCTILWSLLLILKHYLHTIFPVVLIDLRFYKQFGFELYLFNIINPSSFLLQPRLILLLFVENFFHQITRNATKYFHVMVCADVISIYKWNIWKHDNDMILTDAVCFFIQLPKAIW